MSEKLEMERLAIDLEWIARFAKDKRGWRALEPWAAKIAGHIEALAQEVKQASDMVAADRIRIDVMAADFMKLGTKCQENRELIYEASQRLENLASGDIAELRSMVGELGGKQAQLGERYNTLSELRQFDIQRIQALEAANSAREGIDYVPEDIKAAEYNEPSAGEISVSGVDQQFDAHCYYEAVQRAEAWEAMAGKLAELAAMWDTWHKLSLNPGGAPIPPPLDKQSSYVAEYEAMKGKEGE